MKKIIFIILLAVLLTYIFKQISFADTSHFQSNLDAFIQTHGIKN